MATSAGFQSINLLNVNSLYIQGVPFDDNQPSLQAEIDAINAQLIGIEAVTNKIDTTGLTLPPQCIITNATTNQALKTLIDNINVNIGALNKFDVSAMPAAPPATIIITPTTTNQYLNGLITTNTTNIATNTTNIATNTADIVTINGQITTIQGQITSINNSITAINLKLAHFSTFSYGADVMSGIADGTGFACAVSSGSSSGNGIFVYPNTSVQTEQIQLISANDKNILLRGGDQVGIFGAQTASMYNRTLIDIGDKTDIIHIGRNHAPTEFPEIDIGVDYNFATLASASTTNIEGDVYFSSYAVFPIGTTPCLVAETINTLKLGNTNNYKTALNLTGLDVTAVGVVPITLTAISGLITISTILGGIALTCLGGAITMTTGGGACSISTGVGAVSITTGAGVMNFATGAGNISTSTVSGNITLGAGKAVGGTAGNTIIQAKQVVEINPDVETDIYKTGFIEFNDNASPGPITTANRLYQQNNQLYFDGSPVGGAAGAFVLKIGDTMTGTLILPEAATSIVTLTNLLTAPSPITNRLYLLNNTLTFNGVAVNSNSTYVLKAGDTMTGALNINYSQASGTTSQLNIVNTNATGNGGQLRLQNQKTGAGAVLDTCGVVTFAAKNSSSATNVTYATLSGKISDPTAGTHDGILSASVASQGTITEAMRLWSNASGTKFSQFNAKTAIGTSAIGSTPSQDLYVTGTAAITTSLDVPLIINAPDIYPATSTTLVDNAVRKYQPERLYRLIDYPEPLSAPTIDGEKVIILNNTGAPAGGIDQILQASNFPSVSGSSLAQILQNIYVSSTATTPACSYITAAYNDSTISLFVLPDVGGETLTLTAIARFVPTSGQAYVNDFVVTTYGATHRIYAGGVFDTTQYLGGGSNTSCNNFSGQIVLTWGGTEPNYTITSVTAFPMWSNHCPQDVAGSWTNVNGLNAEITCVINVNNVGGFFQPNNTFDSICVGGDFTSLASGGTTRLLARLAYYSFYDADGTLATLYSQPTNTLLTSWGGTQYETLGSFSPINSGNYDSISCECAFQYIQNVPFAPITATMVIELLDPAGAVICSSAPVGVQVAQTYNLLLTPAVPLVAGFYYTIRANCTDFTTTAPFGLLSYGTDGGLVPYCIFTAQLSNGYIGWRTLATDWTNPVGPNSASNNEIRGGGLFSTGALGFIFDGTDVSTSTGHMSTNFIFSVVYDAAELATFSTISADANTIDSTQSWGSGHTNSITGGNPVIDIALNQLSYGELYCNRGFNNSQNVPGVYYRPSSVDPYEMTDCLIFAGNSLTADQLKPNGSSNTVSAVYRDDTLYANVYWVARAVSLETATISGGIPTYTAVTFSGGGAIPCHSFGGYSNEIGYNGLILVCPTDVYLYKGSISGELVIDLSGCVVRCANNIYAQNKLTFPVGQDGTSITLIGDTDVVNPYNKPSWWAISQDGGIYYDNVFVNNNGGVTSVMAGTGIAVSSATGAVSISNTGATSIVAGSNITISSTGAGGTGAVTINASAAGGVTSLAPYTLPSGNATPFLIYPGYLSTGALQGYISPTKLSYYNSFSGNITIGNGLSIFGAAQGVPGGLVGNIAPQFLNTSKKYKLTCSVSIVDSTGGGNFNGGNHWGNFSINFINSTIPSVSYGNIWGAQVAPNLGAPIPQQSSGSVFGTSWTDVFIDAAYSPGQYLSLAQTFIIAYNGNYSATSLSGNVFWELEYVPDP